MDNVAEENFGSKVVICSVVLDHGKCNCHVLDASDFPDLYADAEEVKLVWVDPCKSNEGMNGEVGRSRVGINLYDAWVFRGRQTRDL